MYDAPKKGCHGLLNNHISNDGWLLDIPTCRHCCSPNFNQRPAETDISLLVIHNISLPSRVFSTPYIEQLFMNCLDCSAHPSFHDLAQLTVSSHILINREGGICQFVSFNDRAWHAGVSIFNGIANCNDYSIGIELEGADDIAYTQQQYDQLAMLTKLLMANYPKITLDKIVGHCDIAPDRKTDPGEAFDWDYFYALLESK